MKSEKTSTGIEIAHVPVAPDATSPVLELPFLDDQHEPRSSMPKTIEEIEKEEWDESPDNPLNWTSLRKWTNVAIVSMYTFISPLSSSMMAPGLPEISRKYGITSPTLISLTLSIYLLSYAIGPLVCAPLSEMYGRKWILHTGNILLLAFNIGCAFAPSAGALLGFRFLAGFAGSAPIAVGGGSVSDLFTPKDRASAMALYTMGPLIGPVVGPAAGGFIAQTIGVKYVFIIIAGLCGVGSAIAFPCLRETYGPVIRSKRASLNAVERVRIQPVSKSNPWHHIWINLTRPLSLLFTSFICFILSLYMSFTYGIYYLMFTTFPGLFSGVYGFKPGVGGLVYIGLGVGFFVATGFGARFADGIYHRLAAKNGGIGKPEMRIPALFVGSLFIPVGLFWYGWSAALKIHWIMPIIGSGIFGFGMMTTFLPIQLYLVDAFKYAASATAAASVLRSLLGFAFPLFGQQMFDALGLGGGNSLLAGLAIILGIPFPIWIYYKGEAMRAKSNLNR